MKLKLILKPSIKKVVLTGILLAISFLNFTNIHYLDANAFSWGFPLPVYQMFIARGLTNEEFNYLPIAIGREAPPPFNALNLGIDIIFWYFVTCLIATIYFHLSNKHQSNSLSNSVLTN